VLEINKIYNEDCLLTMQRMEDNFIDMVLTSPPYDNLRNYNGYSFDFESIAKELYRVTKQGGVVVWVVGDATINGSESGTSFKQALYFKGIGFNLHDTMIYAKENPIPLTHNRYEQQFEFMFIFSKGKPKTFNPIMIKCQTVGMLNDRNATAKVLESATRNREEKTEVKGTKQKNNIWFYAVGVSDDKTKHPAVFPEELARDHILSWSNEGDLVYDCFMGSGTTAKMSVLWKRNYIGSEISKEYCILAEKRIKPYKDQLTMF
jgi:DNA modification methylase